MGGSKSRKNQRSNGVSVRDADLTGAPFHVSVRGQSKYIPTYEVECNAGPYAGNGYEPQAVLRDRPSTSGGFSTRKSIDRRETRDDLHYLPSRAHQLGTTYYNFPLPASLPTPAATPSSSPPLVFNQGCSEPEIIDLNYTYTEAGIGMALGSPIQSPVVWSPQVQARQPIRNQSPDSMDEWGVRTQPSRTKSTKWKIWAGLFGKKVSHDTLPEIPVFHQRDYLTFPPPPPEKVRGRGKTTSEKNATQHKPDIQRANTMPTGFNFQLSVDPPKEFPMIPKKKLQQGPLLDVNIPRIEMERYSVMFGNVIKPASTTPSLLARRQATLDRLKVVNEAIAEHEKQELVRPRRATSPQPTKSPAMSLFPTISRTQPETLHLPKRASPLHRSNTSPAALSPNRQTFQIPRQQYEEHTIMLAPTPPPQTTATLSSPWSNPTFLAPDSPTSISSIEIPSKPEFSEPAWEMVTPELLKIRRHAAPPQAQYNALHRKQSLEPLEGPVHILPRKQSLQSSLDALAQAGEEETEELINTAANVSIARQISLSRRQKQMLVPIKARTTNTAKDTPAVQTVIVNERKQMTPILVNVSGGKMRKSERAVLVQA